MSVRKITNVQAARRVLLERRQRCELRSPLSQMRHRFAQIGNDYPTQFTEKQIATFIRQVSRSKKGWARIFRYDPQARMYDALTAYTPKSDGSVVRVWAHRVTPSGFTRLPDPAERGYKTRVQNRRFFSANVSPARAIDFGPCGPCSAEELVAVDTLLETGDQYAVRLAKQCARGGSKGGGILEGLPRRRRRR